MDQQEQPNAAQVQKNQQALQEAVARILRDVELRKWCVDLACKHAYSASGIGVEPVTLARSIYDFITGAASD